MVRAYIWGLESMKNQSNPEAQAALAPDSEVTGTALNDLGWRDGDAQAFAQQRDYLAQNAGIKGLALVAANEVEKARDLFYRDGFVVVRDALAPEQRHLCKPLATAQFMRCYLWTNIASAIAAPIDILLALPVKPAI